MSKSENYGTFTQWNTMQREKEGTPTFCNSMDGPGEYYAKWINQAVKDKYHMISPTSGT